MSITRMGLLCDQLDHLTAATQLTYSQGGFYYNNQPLITDGEWRSCACHAPPSAWIIAQRSTHSGAWHAH